MSSVQDSEVCINCGEEYLTDFDCRTGVYTKLGACKCDRQYVKAVVLVKELRKRNRTLMSVVKDAVKLLPTVGFLPDRDAPISKLYDRMKRAIGGENGENSGG